MPAPKPPIRAPQTSPTKVAPTTAPAATHKKPRVALKATPKWRQLSPGRIAKSSNLEKDFEKDSVTWMSINHGDDAVSVSTTADEASLQHSVAGHLRPSTTEVRVGAYVQLAEGQTDPDIVPLDEPCVRRHLWVIVDSLLELQRVTNRIVFERSADTLPD